MSELIGWNDVMGISAHLARGDGAEVDEYGSTVVVAIAFACVSPDRIAVRGVIFCPQPKIRFLLARLCGCSDEAFNSGTIEEGRASRYWVKEHFNLEDP